MVDVSIPRPLGNGKALPIQLAEILRNRIISREWAENEKFPTEAELVAMYGVSRVTVRDAMKELVRRGLITTKQGRGSYVSGNSQIRAGMQDLTSITSTIREMGHVPKMIYRHKVLRTATAEERERFSLTKDSQVLDIQRKILADGITVCYSYDVLPLWVFPKDFKTSHLTGSVFNFIEKHNGPTPIRAFAEVHAVLNPDVAWDNDVLENQLYVLLDQMHYDEKSRPFMHTKSYFIQGRFNFTVVRTSPYI
jgi:GntR family transcriptional regulator